MKIYRVQADVDEYQQLVPTDDAIWQTDRLTFDATRKVGWEAAETYVFNPRKKRGNFFHLCPGALVLDRAALEEMEDLFEMAGEILPLKVEQEEVYLLNVIDCVNALDDASTDWAMSRTGQRLEIRRYAFHRTRLSESSLFKIPETVRSEVLTYSEVKGSEDEFLSRYQAAGLSGLIFDEIYESRQ